MLVISKVQFALLPFFFCKPNIWYLAYSWREANSPTRETVLADCKTHIECILVYGIRDWEQHPIRNRATKPTRLWIYSVRHLGRTEHSDFKLQASSFKFKPHNPLGIELLVPLAWAVHREVYRLASATSQFTCSLFRIFWLLTSQKVKKARNFTKIAVNVSNLTQKYSTFLRKWRGMFSF